MEKPTSFIGNTPLLKLEQLTGKLCKGEVFIKDESTNPTGTHKDRKSKFLIEKALTENIDTLAIITSGNAGYSLATIAKDTGLRIVTIVSESMDPKIKNSLSQAGAEVREADLSKALKAEHIVSIARTYTREKIWDVTNSGGAAYESIYEEVRLEKPDMILCPIGSGELYLGICSAIHKHNDTTDVLGSYPIRGKSIADKLTAPYRPLQWPMMHAQMQRAYAFGTSHGRNGMTEQEIQWCVDNAPPFLNAEPSALVSLQMIDRLQNPELKMIMISTGKGKCEH